MKQLDHFGKCVGLPFRWWTMCSTAKRTPPRWARPRARTPTTTAYLCHAAGVQAAKQMASELHGEALDALSGFGEEARRLRELADFVVLRKY